MAVRLFIRDKASGSLHEYGSDPHDSLYIIDGELRYVNMQNLCSSPETYEFVHDPKQGKDPNDKELFDIGGDKRGMCSGCKNRDMAACGACIRNPYRSDNYEPDSRIASYENRLLMHTLFQDRPESGFVVCRPTDDVSPNGLEYLFDDNGDVMVFESVQDAMLYLSLSQTRFADGTMDAIMFKYMVRCPKCGCEYIVEPEDKDEAIDCDECGCTFNV